jgi:hypothetical protein
MFVIGFSSKHRVGNKNSIPGRKNQKVGSIFLIVGNKAICQCDEDVQSHEKWGYPQTMKGNLVSLHIPSCAATTFSLRQHVAINRTNAIPEIPRLIETTIILIPSVPLKKKQKKENPLPAFSLLPQPHHLIFSHSSHLLDPAVFHPAHQHQTFGIRFVLVIQRDVSPRSVVGKVTG